MFKRIVLGVSILGMTAMASPVLAQFSQCAPREKMVETLASKYGEVLAAGGLRGEKHVVEIWAAPDTGSWTAIVTTAQGISCVMASGTHWHQEKRVAKVLDVPS
ncbi:MAG: hypothetical protein AAF748_12950 [Pseudomonadota bacterium]